MTNEERQKIETLQNEISSLQEKVEHIFQLNKYRIDSNNDAHFCVSTDSNCGFQFTADGHSMLNANGYSCERLGFIKDSTNPVAKYINAKYGDIVLHAENGKIILDAKNIELHATDPLGGQIVFNASKLIQLLAPNVKATGDYCTITGTSSVAIGGGTVESNAVISNQTTSETDEFGSSFFGKILSGIKRFKKYFKSTCGS